MTVGAGLETFAWRRPDLLDADLRVIEIDHPVTQDGNVEFTYVRPPPLLDEIGALCLERNRATAASSGEHWSTLLTPHEAAGLAEQAGLNVQENLTRTDVHKRYFGGRADRLTPYTLMGYLTASVPG